MTGSDRWPERSIIVAYIRDRIEQYKPDACCRVALENIAGAIHEGEHIGSFTHGELDDLLEHPLRSAPKHYPPGMGEESRRLHREYNKLVAAQAAGAKNGREVVALTDECAAKGIILVPGGENL